MLISVIIPTYNRAADLSRALASLSQQSLDVNNFEVLVVDDGGNDQTQKISFEFKKCLNLKYWRLNHQGVSAARNFGGQQATGEILVFFDDDALADVNWLKNILSAADQDLVVTGRVKSKNNNFWQYFAPHYYQGSERKPSPILLEGNCAINKSVFKIVGWFDKNLDYGHEGSEFIRRLKIHGYQVMYHPELIIYHDYASGIFNYFNKQRRFGEKMSYLKFKEIRNLSDLLLNYSRLKAAGGNFSVSWQKINPWQKVFIKIIAKLGTVFHFAGAVFGYLKYQKIKKTSS